MSSLDLLLGSIDFSAYHQTERPTRDQWTGPWVFSTTADAWIRPYWPTSPHPWMPGELRWWFGPRVIERGDHLGEPG